MSLRATVDGHGRSRGRVGDDLTIHILRTSSVITAVLSFHAVIGIVVFVDFFNRLIRILLLHEHRIDVHIVCRFLRLDTGGARERHQDRTIITDAGMTAAVDGCMVVRGQRTRQLVDAVERIVARTTELLKQGLEATEQIMVSAISVHTLGIKVLDQLNIALSWLGVGVGVVLLQNFVHWPLLNLADAGNDTAGAVTALIAVDVHRVVLRIQREQNRVTESIEVGLDLSLLVGLDVKNDTLDTAGGHEVVVGLARCCLDDQCAGR